MCAHLPLITHFSLNIYTYALACWTGQRHTDGEAEQLAGPVQRRHQHARERVVDDRGAAGAGHHHTAAISLPVSAQPGMMGGLRV